MRESAAVSAGLGAFYQAFNTHDPDQFGAAVSLGPGVSVIGSAPGEGHQSRDSWLKAYTEGVAAAGLRLEGGPRPSAWEEGGVGFALDAPRFLLPDGRYLPTRLSAVLRREDERWKVVHLHFSVGTPDEDALQPAP